MKLYSKYIIANTFSKGDIVTLKFDPERRGMITGEIKERRGLIYYRIKAILWPAPNVEGLYDWSKHSAPVHEYVPEDQLELVTK